MVRRRSSLWCPCLLSPDAACFCVYLCRGLSPVLAQRRVNISDLAATKAPWQPLWLLQGRSCRRDADDRGWLRFNKSLFTQNQVTGLWHRGAEL